MFRKLGILIWMLGMFILPSWPAMPNRVTVRLFQAYSGIERVRVHGTLRLIKPVRQTLRNGDYQVSVRQGQLIIVKPSAKRPVVQANKILLNATQGSISLQPGSDIPARQYSGWLEFRIDSKGKLEIHNIISARTYVAVVVGSETSPGWPLEALKAQAVLTQTGLSRYQAGDVIGDSTQREVYLGLSHLRSEVNKAVSDVWGQTLVYNNRPITPFYHASCGGHTSDSRLLGTQKSIPWLTAVRCTYCRKAPFSKETHTTIPKMVFGKSFTDSLPTIIQADRAGRPLLMQFKNGKRITGYDFWIRLGQRFGWDKAPGMRFSLSPLSNGNIQITSTGAGHGLGLCQWGAAEMAHQGKLYPDILRFYFPKAIISKH